MGLTWDLLGIYMGFAMEAGGKKGTASQGTESSRRISLKPILIWEMVFGMVFTFFLKDNVHNVIATENNGIIVTRAFFRIFQAYRIR